MMIRMIIIIREKEESESLTLRDVFSPAKERRNGPANGVGPREQHEDHCLAGGHGGATDTVYNHIVAIVGDEYKGPDGAETEDGSWKSKCSVGVSIINFTMDKANDFWDIEGRKII